MALDMAEKQDAALLDLPAELRVLAAFLQDDERPTVVLGKGQDGGIGEGQEYQPCGRPAWTWSSCHAYDHRGGYMLFVDVQTTI